MAVILAVRQSPVWAICTACMATNGIGSPWVSESCCWSKRQRNNYNYSQQQQITPQETRGNFSHYKRCEWPRNAFSFHDLPPKFVRACVSLFAGIGIVVSLCAVVIPTGAVRTCAVVRHNISPRARFVITPNTCRRLCGASEPNQPQNKGYSGN